jgi:energy-converting hydrogenase Eha subunit A
LGIKFVFVGVAPLLLIVSFSLRVGLCFGGHVIPAHRPHRFVVRAIVCLSVVFPGKSIAVGAVFLSIGFSTKDGSTSQTIRVRIDLSKRPFPDRLAIIRAVFPRYPAHSFEWLAAIHADWVFRWNPILPLLLLLF